MEFYGSLEFYGIFRILLSFMEFYGVLWNFMEFYGFMMESLEFKGIYGILWIFCTSFENLNGFSSTTQIQWQIQGLSNQFKGKSINRDQSV